MKKKLKWLITLPVIVTALPLVAAACGKDNSKAMDKTQNSNQGESQNNNGNGTTSPMLSEADIKTTKEALLSAANLIPGLTEETKQGIKKEIEAAKTPEDFQKVALKIQNIALENQGKVENNDGNVPQISEADIEKAKKALLNAANLIPGLTEEIKQEIREEIEAAKTPEDFQKVTLKIQGIALEYQKKNLEKLENNNGNGTTSPIIDESNIEQAKKFLLDSFELIPDVSEEKKQEIRKELEAAKTHEDIQKVALKIQAIALEYRKKILEEIQKNNNL
ncbi:hypothetical protein DA803_03285 [[Mycoplasma] phocae]|uniref:Lipoprotein n=1 Tax=[Mycoplasma] phocae TaxID=142651 RepID=A0A2Z5IQF6_9BACT|nr:variable surface lipoprotein [[Mycoplasma] phocae]AXE61093.1 hypothetical protein DA803_03285 [[Mycoplasma] phocae]